MHTHPDKIEPPPPAPPPPDDETAADGSSDGMLDLDEHDGINNQHLEVR